MSNLAYAPPRRRPERETPRPHIEIAPSRAQRRARPRASYAVITLASLFTIFGAQLLLSIVVSDGAYQIAHLQDQQKELLRSEEALTESLDLAGSTQSLAINAASLGMVPVGAPLYLDLGTGAVTGTPGVADRTGCGGGCNLVANALLDGMTPLTHASAAAAATAATTTTAATTPTTTPTPASPATPVDALPAPVTH